MVGSNLRLKLQSEAKPQLKLKDRMGWPGKNGNPRTQEKKNPGIQENSWVLLTNPGNFLGISQNSWVSHVQEISWVNSWKTS